MRRILSACGIRIIPAYAGSTHLQTWKGWSGKDHPRIRGEHGPDGSVVAGPGWIIPAYAGSTTTSPPSSAPAADHPRIRGEHQTRQWQNGRTLGSSPHTRGALLRLLGPDLHGGIIPAYAGSTPTSPDCSTRSTDHPRIRGEHRRGGLRVGQRAGIIPAYAGSTSRQVAPCSWAADHPRIRGEHVPVPAQQRPDAGSSPHTRGARPGEGELLAAVGIIPAYAGSTSGGRGRRRRWWDHPRIRGEHAAGRSCAWEPTGIIPAYAGSTRPRRLPGPGDRDHPRIRGEHRTKVYDSAHHRGSSPHTRGARRR